MKIEPKGAPNAPSDQSNSQAPMSARDRAIAKLTQAAPTPSNASPQHAHPVANPNAISPEEMSVVAQKTPRESENYNNSESLDSSQHSEEPKAATPPEQKKAEDPLSTQYANLARKERALRAKAQQQEQAIKDREAAIIAREEAIKAKEADYTSNYIPRSKLAQDPLSVLTEAGVSYDDITKAILNPQAQQDPRIVAEIEKLKQEIQSQRQATEQAKKSWEEQQQRQYQQALSEIRNETKQLVNSDPAYETIKETDSVQDVVDLIESTYKENGVLLTVEEAAREVEEYLVEEATKFVRIGKIKSKLESLNAQKQAQEQPKPQQQNQVKTLTNSVNAAKKLTARERAIAAFKGEKV